MDNIISTERKEFIMKNFSTVRKVMIRQLLSLIALVGFLNTGINAQCIITSTCPGQISEEVLVNGDCDLMVTLDVPSTNDGCVLELFVDGVSIGSATSNATTTLSHLFPIGTSFVEWRTPDEDVCDFNVIVTDIDGAIESISCNDFVQVSLGDDCSVTITPDIITEGGPYGCFELFEVNIEGLPGDVITSPGTYNVQVTSPIGNSCWGVVLVEDKVGPVLECKDAVTTCSQSTDPGTFVCEFAIVEQTDASTGDVTFTVTTDVIDAPVKDVSIEISIETLAPSEISGSLVSPNGTTVDLFSMPGNENGDCDVADIHVSFSTDAIFSQQDLIWNCGDGVLGITGNYLPIDPLTAFNGEVAAGLWTLELSDTDPITAYSATGILTVGSTIDTICFPLDISGGIVPNGENQFLVDGFGNCGPIELLFQDDVTSEDCSTPLWETIERTWLATDPAGNTSSCVQIIEVLRPDLSMILFPNDWDGFDYPPLDCFEDFARDANGNPDPSRTGMPAFPSGYSCDNIQMSYEDLRIDICPTAYKVLRTWSLLDWCTGEVITHQQVIKVVDETPPFFTCPLEEDQEFLITGSFSCLGTITLPAPTLDSLHLECSDVQWRVRYKVFPTAHPENCFEPDDSNYNITDFASLSNSISIDGVPQGCVYLLYETEDECGNRWEEECKIIVRDGTPPTAVCIENTVAAVGANGCVKIFAESFDNGSHDNCEIASIDVRREDDPEDVFFPYVEFCCDDIPGPHLVEFRVIDKAGLSNICWIEVVVQDKLPPIITCPDDVTINCTNLHRDPEFLGFPEVVDNVTIDENGDPICPLPEVVWEDDNGLDQCGAGLILRTFTATDPTNAELFASCVQRIYVVNMDPLEEEDIDFPDDHDEPGCMGSLQPEDLPEGYDFPTFPEDECSLVAFDYKDQLFEFAPGACIKILRTWTVIDWCQFEEGFPNDDPNQNGIQDGIWEHVQVIQLTESDAPEFVSCQDTVFIAGFGACEQELNYQNFAEDECTDDDNLNWSYEIDLFNDGTKEIFGEGDIITDVLPFGCHDVKWFVEDFCGNVNICEQIFCVEDEKNPTPYCISEITTVVMNNNGMVTIWANDFDFGSFDNCGPIEHISFSSDVNDINMTFDCEDIPNGVEAEVDVQVWVTDMAGNQDFCTVTLVLQDNNGDACVDNNNATVNASGVVRTEDDRMVESAEVLISADVFGFPQMVVTPDNGTYQFSELQINQDYNITATRGEDYLNGVSTLDIVRMQKHILGIEVFNSPYKVIAADVDGSNSVSAIDLVNLRRLILGAISVLPNEQPSWKFVDADQDFDNINQPWPVNETINLYGVNGNMLNQDLIAVKMGDVTYNANASGFGDDNMLENRSAQNIDLILDRTEIKAGESIDIPVYISEISEIVGFQYAINLGSNLAFNGITDGQITFADNNYRTEKNTLFISWDHVYGSTINPDEALFYISVTANSDASSTELSLLNDKLNAEIYDLDGTVYGLEIENRSELTTEFVVYQNKPNPFSAYTDIEFDNPSASNVTLTITDVQGRVIVNQTAYYESGNHTIRLNAQDLSDGILYYTLESDTARVSNRMIVIK